MYFLWYVLFFLLLIHKLFTVFSQLFLQIFKEHLYFKPGSFTRCLRVAFAMTVQRTDLKSLSKLVIYRNHCSLLFYDTRLTWKTNSFAFVSKRIQTHWSRYWLWITERLFNYKDLSFFKLNVIMSLLCPAFKWLITKCIGCLYSSCSQVVLHRLSTSATFPFA